MSIRKLSVVPLIVAVVVVTLVVTLGVTLVAGAATPPAAQRVALPDGKAGIGFDDLRYSARLHRLLVPGGRAGNLALIDPDTMAITTVGGFGAISRYAGGHDDGPPRSTRATASCTSPIAPSACWTSSIPPPAASSPRRRCRPGLIMSATWRSPTSCGSASPTPIRSRSSRCRRGRPPRPCTLLWWR